MIVVRSPTLPSCSVEFLLLEVRRDFLRGRPKQIHRPHFAFFAVARPVGVDQLAARPSLKSFSTIIARLGA